MKEKGNDILFFEDLMDRAHFVQPASEEARAITLKSEKAVLRKILKETGQWSLVFGILIGLSYILKKLKILLLANKIISAFAVVTLGLGTYYAADYFNKVNDENIIIEEQTPVVIKPKVIQRKEKPVLNIKNKIEFHNITSTSVDGAFLKSINRNIRKELSIYNAGRIVRNKENDNKYVKYLIIGDAEDMGDSIQFYVKIIDKETSEVINIFKKLMSKESNINKECKNISKELSTYLK